MPGRNPKEAVESYARPIRETLSCVTDAIIGYNGGVYPSNGNHTLCFVNTPPVGRLFGTHLSLFFSQNYSLQQSPTDQEWKVQTESYFYRVDDEHGNEILSYHWHPTSNNTPPFPHLHLKRKGSGVTRGEVEAGHLPTGRIAIESVVLFLIRDFRVTPRSEDALHKVERNLEIFERYRSWA